MHYYFTGTDPSGQEISGVVEASSEDAAEFLIQSRDTSPLEVRPATEEEVADSELNAVGVAVKEVDAEGASMLPLTGGKARLHRPDGDVSGQLSFALTGRVQRLVFSNPAADIEEVEDRWLDIPVTDLEAVEKHGLLTKRLELTTSDGSTHVISGDVSQAYLLIRFSMIEQTEQD